MFAPACVAAVAANTKATRISHLAAQAKYMRPCSSSKAGAPASKAIAASFAGTNLCSSPRCLEPVHGAAATRKSLPSFNAGSWRRNGHGRLGFVTPALLAARA